jgi:hypothetical protein
MSFLEAIVGWLTGGVVVAEISTGGGDVQSEKEGAMG